MKRNVASASSCGRGGLLALVLAFVLIPGCSGGEPDGSKNREELATKYGVSQSELLEIKKANMNPAAFKKALEQRQIEQRVKDGDLPPEALAKKKVGKRKR